MIEKSARFATYSRPLCWVVAGISLLVAILTFSGGAENGLLRGLLWLGLAAVFAASAVFLGRNQPAPPAEDAVAAQPSAAPDEPGADVGEREGQQDGEQASEQDRRE